MKTIDERFHLKKKVAVIVGGNGALCSTLARAFIESGMRVNILDIAKAQGAVKDPLLARASYYPCDVTSKEDLLRCRDRIFRRFRRIDLLLNGAGANAPTPFLEVTREEFQKIIDVNLLGTLYGCQVFGETMVAQRSGSIINFTSVSSGPPLSKALVYSAAKAGVVSLTQNFAREWAPFRVRVNALRPGFFPTQWSMRHFIDEKRRAKIFAHTPMGRFGRPEELVGAALWLASDAASFVTGSVVAVDGGFTAMTL